MGLVARRRVVGVILLGRSAFSCPYTYLCFLGYFFFKNGARGGRMIADFCVSVMWRGVLFGKYAFYNL